MSRRLARLAVWTAAIAVAAMAVIVTWTGGPGGNGEFPETGTGAHFACDVPVRWRVAEIDPGFRLGGERVDRATVRAAAERAAKLWEEAAGRDLFRRDPSEGVPIRLVFTDRQRKLQGMLGELVRFDSTRGALADSAAVLERAGRRIADRRQRLNREIERLNERVERLNRGGGASRREVAEVRREQRDLREERRELRARERAFEERRRRLRRARERLEEELGAYDETDRPASAGRAGRYSEERTARDGRVVSVEERSIAVYQFADRGDLTRVLAHELGHALGLGHAADSAALMTGTRILRAGARRQTELTRADRALLRRECPELLGADPADG